MVSYRRAIVPGSPTSNCDTLTPSSNSHHTKVTDDFKTESFIIYKTFEIVAESLPQVFLQALVLAKTWENWKADWSNISGSNSGKSEFCSDQKVFFVSLVVSGIQIGVTLQDLMERDVPYGVFPRILSSGMAQKSLLKSCKWQLMAFAYYTINIFLRLFVWVPFTILYGFFYGFVVVYIIVFVTRSLLVAMLLAQCKLGGLKNITAAELETTELEYQEEDNEEDDIGFVRTQSDTHRSFQRDRGYLTSINWYHVNALLAETLPWTMLGVFLDLPLSMTWLRAESNEETKEEDILQHYRHSKNFFFATNVLSTIENIAMFVLLWYTGRMEMLECGPIEVDRVGKLKKIEEHCHGGGYTGGNLSYVECKGRGNGLITPQHLPYPYIQKMDEYRELFLTLCIVGLSLKILISFGFSRMVWSSQKYATVQRERGASLQAKRAQRRARATEGRSATRMKSLRVQHSAYQKAQI